MKKIDLLSSSIEFSGAMALEKADEGIITCRLSGNYKEFLPERISQSNHTPSGVRLVTISNTTSLAVELEIAEDGEEGQAIDLLIDHQLTETQRFKGNNRQRFEFTDLPLKNKLLELWLPNFGVTTIRSLEIDDNATCQHYLDQRPRWTTYGSSITMCRRAESPSKAWPAMVAGSFNWNLHCLGFGGECHFDPVIARDIAANPADFISLCLGINTQGSSFNERTWAASVTGFIFTIRDGHPFTPLLIMSPIFSCDRETKPGLTGLTLPMMREWLKETVEKFRKRGDRKIAYIDGLEIFSEADAKYLPDNLHPDATGIQLMGKRITEKIRQLNLLPSSMLPFSKE